MIDKPRKFFLNMLCLCKVTKFWKINYKILARILATPKMISSCQNKENIQWCVWCGVQVTLEHIFLWCPDTIALHEYIVSQESLQHLTFTDASWIFGLHSKYWNPIVWVTNFVIYKSLLITCEGRSVPLLLQLELECKCYQTIFSALTFIDW